MLEPTNYETDYMHSMMGARDMHSYDLLDVLPVYLVFRWACEVTVILPQKKLLKCFFV